MRTFEAAAFLRRSGADMTRVRKMLRDNIDSYKARAEAVRTAEIYRGCFAIANVRVRDWKVLQLSVHRRPMNF